MHGKEKLTRSLASVPRSGVRVIIMVFLFCRNAGYADYSVCLVLLREL